MAAAYAALISLLNTMDQFQSHPRLSASLDRDQNEFLRSNVDFFLEFVENYSDEDINEVGDLVRRIAVAAHAAEDIIEVEAAVLIRGGSSRNSQTLLQNLQRKIEDMNSIKEKVIKLKEETGLFINSMPPPPPPPSSSTPTATTKATMVGFDGYMAQLLDELTSSHSGRQILPIVGMGGIGKTTLSRNVYENSAIVHIFDVRAWVSVSQEYNATEILLQALSCLGGSKSRNHTSADELGVELYKTLYCRRYLVVLDDVWSIEAWEKIKFFFPDNGNRSRIVVTTRQQQVVDYFASSALALEFLDDNDSWDLFCYKTFPLLGYPPELEQVGKKIARKCKGLPLAISVIGGFLRKSPRTQQYWEKIAEDKSLVLEISGDQGKNTFSILYLSYKSMPVWLKSCFLYLGLFPEDHQILVSKLIQLWIAEGFIKPSRNQSLEEVSESYVKDLVDRNLLLVSRLRLNKKFDTCYLHDVVREMCIKVSEKEKFYNVQRDIDGKRHFVVDETSASWFYTHMQPQSLSISERPSPMRPLIFQREREVPFKSRLLRLLVDDTGHVDPTFQQVNLRFIFHKSIRSSWTIPSPISLCWSLQSLILVGAGSVVLPPEIWKMPQLRHIDVSQSMYLPDLPASSDIFAMPNLQTLRRAKILRLSKDLCKRILNIKDLEIEVEESCHFHMQNLRCLNKLESLYYSCTRKNCSGYSVCDLILPSSIRELVFHNCSLVWSDMSIIASLPHLQILQLHNDPVIGTDWNCGGWDCGEDVFLSLKHLYIQDCEYLIYWNAHSSNFPVLETLSLRSTHRLNKIPSAIGEIPTIENMHIYDCSQSTTISAIKILKEQESLGNQDLQLQLQFKSKADVGIWREKIQRLGYTGQNLHMSSRY